MKCYKSNFEIELFLQLNPTEFLVYIYIKNLSVFVWLYFWFLWSLLVISLHQYHLAFMNRSPQKPLVLVRGILSILFISNVLAVLLLNV